MMTERDRFINIIKRSISGMLTTNQAEEIANIL